MRDIPVGNGSLLVNFDDKYQLRDLYFPFVGQENHSEGFPFRFGVWVDGEFSWVFSDDWERDLVYLPQTLVTDVRLVNNKLAIELRCHDMVASGENIYLKRVVLNDLKGSYRQARTFLHHDFRIYENKVGDTAFYDPQTLSLIHYKKHRYFLINTIPHFDEFATGRKAFRNQEGTWRDAEDGHLHGGAITEGSVDSTVGIWTDLEPNGSSEFFYWIAAGTSHSEVGQLNKHVLDRGPEPYFREIESAWRAWVVPPAPGQTALSAKIDSLYRRSLLIIQTQTDDRGAIIAASDHEVTERATDHYSYLWPRDGAFVANAMDSAGYPNITRQFLTLCAKIVHDRGYFLQKYNPDGTVGSGWHPYWNIRTKTEMLPIQEDETALVLWAAWEHFARYGDEAFFKEIYAGLIVRCADFMAAFRDPETGLPRSSWNLWEDRRGVHTFTCSTVVAGLRAAANFADVFGDRDAVRRYRSAADEIVAGMRTLLFSEAHGRFLRAMLADENEVLHPDPTVDASLFGIFYFGCFAVDEPTVVATMAAVEERLTNRAGVGGVARFENDGYMRTWEDSAGNPWFICTLWLAEYYIARAAAVDDLIPALKLIDWVADHALPSGVLAEQADPQTGHPISVSPLTWSHSTFVEAVNSYLAALGRLKVQA